MSGRQHRRQRRRELTSNPAQSETLSMRGRSLHGKREIPQSPGGEGPSGRSEKAKGRTSDMHDCGKSDGFIVPKKPSNKDAGGPASAERVEGRGPTKRNALQTTTHRTQCRASVSSGLQRVREVARKDKEVRFTALLHHVSTDQLRESYYALERKAAPGVDGETWEEYGQDLENRMVDLHSRVHRGAYRAKPSRRTYIAKADGSQRPIGVAAVEDKVLQHAVVKVLQQIYEEDFHGFSYGSRPERGAHDALDALWVGLMGKKVNWVLDADIRGFFDTLDHEWLMKFLEHRIADRRVLRLIRKWLRAGVLEEGEWSETEEGTPQGSVISPLLANVYLHYVLDLWVQKWRKKNTKGDVIIVRYVDDFVLGIQCREEAERFLEGLKERFGMFGLKLHPEKTRLIEFGRFAAENRKKRGLGKPETFDFLGFTHYCGKKRKTKRFTVQRKTITKRLRAKLKIIRTKLKRRRHRPAAETGAWLRSLVRGYMNYHGIPGNWHALEVFRREINRAWLFALRRRSQKHRMPWKRFNRTLVNRWIPRIQIRHPYPDARFDAKYSR